MQNVFQHGEEIGEVGTRSDLNTIVVNFILWAGAAKHIITPSYLLYSRLSSNIKWWKFDFIETAMTTREIREMSESVVLNVKAGNFASNLRPLRDRAN